jgi:TolA-binding protein
MFYNVVIKTKGGFRLDWKCIKAEYVADGISLRELSIKHGVSFSTIQKKSMEEKWGDLRKKRRRKTEEKIIDAVVSKEVKKATDIVDVADKLLGKISEMLDMDVNAYNTQNIKNLTSALKDLKDIKGIKSEADHLEQMARIAKLQKEAEDEVKDTTVIVQFEEDITKWSK